MQFCKIGFIGLGLIGGSICKTIKRLYPKTTMIATAGHASTVAEAYEDGTITNPEPLELQEFADCDIIFLCCPVQRNIEYLQQLRSIVSEQTIITDVGSVKSDIHKEVIRLGMEANFIGGHPMTGSEKIGYSNATPYLLENAYYIITPTTKTSGKKSEEFEKYIASLGATTMQLDYTDHDHATAAISHLPHVIAASLVHLVESQDDENETMKTIAAGGFKDITRIASSSPVMWQNICLSNATQIEKLMDCYMKQLDVIRTQIHNQDADALIEYFSSSKNYRDSLSITKRGPIQPVYEIYCDLLDETGGIATIATILAEQKINIKNIGIINNREFEQGVLRIEFYNEDTRNQSIELLQSRKYTIYTR